MDDDFNTALALGNIFELVRAANRLIAEANGLSPDQAELLAATRKRIREAGQVLGLFHSEPGAFLDRIKGQKMAGMEIGQEEIEQLIAERAAARKAKDFKRSDEIRDLLLARNIVLLDGPEGTTWKVK